MAIQAAKKQKERIDLRSTVEEKSLIQKAASFLGITPSAFVRSHAVEAAKKVIVEHETLVLPSRDRDIFIVLLDNPPEPTSSLKAAMKRHTKKYG